MSSTLSTNRSDVGMGSTNIHEADLIRPLTAKGLFYFTLSAVASCLSHIATRSTLDCCSVRSWSVPYFFPQVDLDPFLLRKLPF